MADFNDLKGAFLNTLGTVAGKTRDFAEKATDKAKDVARIAKLNMELSAEKDTIQKAYLEIGKLYYETRKNSPDGFFCPALRRDYSGKRKYVKNPCRA